MTKLRALLATTLVQGPDGEITAPACRQLETMPGIGPITASVAVATAGDGSAFRSGHPLTSPSSRTPSGLLLERATRIGPDTREALVNQARPRKHPEETLRSAQGILRLAQDFIAGRARTGPRPCRRLAGLQLPHRAYAHQSAAM